MGIGDFQHRLSNKLNKPVFLSPPSAACMKLGWALGSGNHCSFLHCHLKEQISRILLQPLHHQTPCMGYILPTRRNPLSFWRSAEVNRATKRHTWQVSLPMDGRGNKPSSQTGLHQVNLKNQLLTLSWSLSRIISLSKCAPKNGWKSFGAKTKKAPKS